MDWHKAALEQLAKISEQPYVPADSIKQLVIEGI